MGLVPQRINADPIPRARLRRAAEKPIARTRAANTALPRPSAPEAEPSDWSADVPALRRQLLAWWQAHGRRDIPWKLRRDGSPPDPGEDLDPYGVFVAEVMRAARQHTLLWPVRVCRRQQTVLSHSEA